MHLIHMRLKRARRGKLPSAELAGEVAILLMLQQNVRVLELFLAVETERLQHVNASLFPSHLTSLALTNLMQN